MKKLEHLSFAKSILMICVIAGHSCAYWTGGWFSAEDVLIESPFLNYLSEWFGSFHTYAFTMISGLLYAYHEKNKGIDSLIVILGKKFKRLIIPYCFISICWVIPLSQFFYHYSIDTVLIKYLLGRSPSQLWFLLMLFWVFVIFRLIQPILNKCRYFYVIFPVLFVSSIFIPESFNWFQLIKTFEYLLYFSIGYVYMKHFSQVGLPFGETISVSLFACAMFVVDIALFIFGIGIKPGLFGIAYRKLLNIVGCIMAVVLLCNLGRRIEKGSVLNLFENNSFTMYMLHQQIIYFSLTMFNGIMPPPIHAVLNFLIAVILSLGISILMHKSSKLSFLLGE